jgi:hypothetical protein
VREEDHLGRICEDNIKMDLQDVGWTQLAQDKERRRALWNAVMNLPVP